MVNVAMHIFDIIKCEYLTAKYAHEFENAEVKDIDTIGKIDFIKVLYYGEDQARVYYVSNDKHEGHVGGTVYTSLKKEIY